MKCIRILDRFEVNNNKVNTKKNNLNFVSLKIN